MDVLAELGELALASRLKRLSELLLRDASALYADLGVDFQGHWFGLFHHLQQHHSMAVTELSQALGMTHPAVNKIAGQLAQRGLVESRSDPRDERRRLLNLTPRGRRLGKELAPAWSAFREAAREVLDEAGVDLVDDIDRFEAACAARSVVDRVRQRLELPPRSPLEIVDYRPAYKKYFRALNEAWLTEHFRIEAYDASMLADPNRRILRRGGCVLFARQDGAVVGTCALLRHPSGHYELAKMAVAPEARGRGIGTALTEAIVARARAAGADALYLHTSLKLKAAARLYRRFGFRRVGRSPVPTPELERSSITMRLNLTGGGPTAAAREES